MLPKPKEHNCSPNISHIIGGCYAYTLRRRKAHIALEIVDVGYNEIILQVCSKQHDNKSQGLKCFLYQLTYSLAIILVIFCITFDLFVTQELIVVV